MTKGFVFMKLKKNLLVLSFLSRGMIDDNRENANANGGAEMTVGCNAITTQERER